jgi:hypothetical protein
MRVWLALLGPPPIENLAAARDILKTLGEPGSWRNIASLTMSAVKHLLSVPVAGMPFDTLEPESIRSWCNRLFYKSS